MPDQEQSPFVRALTRLLVVTCFCSCLVPWVLSFAGKSQAELAEPGSLVKTLLLTAEIAIVVAVFRFVLKGLGRVIDAGALEQARFLDGFDSKYVDAAILGSAALSLFLELAMIRWHSSVLEFLAFYKNFSLLACFLGLGLGYALAKRDHIPLLIAIPLMAWQFVLLIAVRFGLPQGEALRAVPFREQFSMGIHAAALSQIVAVYVLLTAVFLTTALTFVPIGQLCGRLMERQERKLRAYGLNLLGSLLGVMATFLASALWTPPLVWFVPCFAAVLLFHSRKPAYLMAGFAAAGVCAIVLAWPVRPLWDRVYSPYQLLEIGRSEDTGLTLIRAAGHYYQRIHDFSSPKANASGGGVREYYDFPYRAASGPRDVAVVGAGTGNDVAAALRAGARSVDAIEIDPAILLVGKTSHPEKPYDSPKVRATVNDARSFLRTTDHTYDLIVYGLLDSHTLLSQGSSVRLDSFVYTVEGLREARNRLKPGGMISLSFSVMSDQMARKIYLMMQQAFDGRPPTCIMAGYDYSTIFLESNDEKWTLPGSVLEGTGFIDQSAALANPSLHADVSTDDWPFFYMPRRVYPTSYLVMVFQILLLSLFVTGSFIAERPRFSHVSFFFLGAGFMLVETKGITEMGLTFGNTWQVVGVVIASILAMAWVGNSVVGWLKIERPLVPYLLLWAALAFGWFAARSGGFASTPIGRIETAIVLTCPLLFSGIVFSTLLSGQGGVSGMMAMNLLGAICGGLLEYNSMYFGFQSLYVLAMGCYLLAFVSDLVFMRRARAGAL
jgi:hypothetical protein